jgi:type IV fimbrial biogenesis protein FimT
MSAALQRRESSRTPLGRGFTIIELLITIAVIAVAAAVALPSFREFNIRMAVTSTTNDLVHAINVARAEAAKRGSNVTVTAAGSWTNGWSVLAGAETILRHDALAPTYTIQSKSTGGGSDTVITFLPTGNLLAATSFDLNVCRPTADANAAQSRRVTIQGSGTVSSRRSVSGSPAGSC